MMDEYKFSIDVTKLLNVLERLADALERIADNTAAIEALRQEVFVGWTAINRRLAELYQRRKDKEAE